MSAVAHSPRRLAAFTWLLLALTLLEAAYFASRALVPFRPEPSVVGWSGHWIAAGPETYGGHFRYDLNLPGAPRHAWVRLAAYDAFELCVNGNPVGHSFLWRPTRPYQNGLSEAGQRLRGDPPLLYLNYPREYQWSGHAEHRVPVYFDLTPYLRPGRNVLSMKLETRRAPARFVLEGEVVLGTGAVIPLRSGPAWRAAPHTPPQAHLEWNDPRLDDQDWPTAQTVPAPGGASLRLFPEEIFSAPFTAPWFTPGAITPTDLVRLRGRVTLPAGTQEAWLRLKTNRAYECLLNGQRVNVASAGLTDFSTGDWLLGSQAGLDLPSAPELLDPDEVGQLFVGQRFITPRHSDPTADDFHPYENELNRTHDRPTAAGRADRNSTDRPAAGGPAVAPGDYRPGERTPLALTRNRNRLAYDAFLVSSLIRSGPNEITLELRPDFDPVPLNFGPEAAVELWARTRTGTQRVELDPAAWTAERSSAGNLPQPSPLAVRADPKGGGATLSYRGYAYTHGHKLLLWSLIGLLHLAVGVALTHRHLARTGATPAALARLASVLLVAFSFLSSVLLLYGCFYERSEGVAFLGRELWGATWLTALAATWWAARRTPVTAPAAAAPWWQALPRSRLWPFLVAWLLLLTFAVRAYRLDFQTIDDDEYASIQASLAIAEQGVPAYSADVWYTRSPLYHYLSGAIIKVAGANLWTLRLPGVGFAVLTAGLIYLIGARAVRCPWTGLGAMLLFALHPLMVFSAHIARFYQQQQFFALLTVYAFLQGFVAPPGPRTMAWRFGTLAALLGAILSQELSLVFGLQLAFGYLLFAPARPARDELRFILVAACVVAVTAIDLAVFQVRTLTRVEGISPNVEATLAPNFSSPMNFLSVFLAYSRLHLGLSLLLALGLPFMIKSRNRLVLALLFLLVGGIVMTNVLVTGQSLRYQYWLMPLWLLLGVHSLRLMLDYLGDFHPARPAWLEPVVAGLLFTAVLLSFSPWRLPGSFGTKLLGDASGAFAFIRAHRLPGDAVAATEPHPHGALLEVGRCDYDLAMPLLYDFVYLKDGTLRDRNASAEVIATVQQLASACARHERLWIAVNREKFRSRGDNLRWDYPSARAELFLRENCTIAHETYLWTVFLWDARQGRYAPFQQDWAHD